LVCISVAAFALNAYPGPMLAVAREHGQDQDVAVGAELLAIRDVTLHRAEIARGSRVSVTGVIQHDGHIDAVEVALADGHVVKLSAALVHASFRVVGD
jgi:hypothetical protein